MASEPGSDPTVPAARTRSPAKLVAVLVAAIVLGAIIGLLAGRGIASGQADSNDEAADRASRAEDDARDERDQLDAQLKLLDVQTKPLKDVATSAPLLATDDTAEVEPGSEFSVDGGTYTVHGFQVVDSFRSQDPKREAAKLDGQRWALVDMTYRNDTREDSYPACGIMQTVRLVLEDGSTVDEVRDKPPVHPDTYKPCGFPIAPGKSGRWVAPVQVAEGAMVSGVHVADVYVRSSGSRFKVRAGKPAWMPFDEPVDVGKVGADEIEMEFGEVPS